MSKSNSLWHYSLFQVPALVSASCLVLAGIAALLGFGCPGFWVSLFLGLSWVAFTWMLVLPLDKFLRSKLNIGMGLTGRLSFLQAIFWSVATLSILMAVLPPLMESCLIITSQPASRSLTASPSLSSISSTTPTPVQKELVSLDWARWRASIWNQMFLNHQNLGSIGSSAEFNFVIYRDGHIEDIQVKTDDPLFKDNLISRIKSLEGTKALVFLKSSRRDTVRYESSVRLCDEGKDNSPNCGKPADPNNYEDKETVTKPSS
jgi:hypothetical protein